LHWGDACWRQYVARLLQKYICLSPYD
jgi:hypothetical protein